MAGNVCLSYDHSCSTGGLRGSVCNGVSITSDMGLLTDLISTSRHFIDCQLHTNMKESGGSDYS